VGGGPPANTSVQQRAVPPAPNPEVNVWISSLLAGTGQQTFPAPATAPPVQTPDLNSLLNSLKAAVQQPAPPPHPAAAAAPNIDINALIAQITQPPAPLPPQQRIASPPPPSRQHNERDTRKGKKRDTESRIKASRLDDIRESVRNSNPEQNMYRALCQFYVLLFLIVLIQKTGNCKVGDGCTFVHPRDMTMYDQ
jgi:hypothetical protein